VLTNKNLSFLGLEEGFHYILIKKSNNWITSINNLSSNYKFRKLMAYRAWAWSKKIVYIKKHFCHY